MPSFPKVVVGNLSLSISLTLFVITTNSRTLRAANPLGRTTGKTYSPNPRGWRHKGKIRRKRNANRRRMWVWISGGLVTADRARI